MVVVEGTSPENLMYGPGLVRSSPMPGQGGVSEIYGRLGHVRGAVLHAEPTEGRR